MKVRTVVSLLKSAIQAWQRDDASRLAAALAYYTTFSLAPVLVIVIAIAGAVFGQEAVQGELVNQLRGLLGQQGADVIQTLLSSTQTSSADGFWPTLISVGLLIFGATNVFSQLQTSLNLIWNVTPPKQGPVQFVRTRLLSFAMVAVIGFLLLVSLMLSAGLAALGNVFSEAQTWAPLWQGLNAILSFGVVTLLFGLIYKVLPDVKITWPDVGVGAAITALLFTIGKVLIGLYLGNSSVGSAYGAAGSLAVILIWVYYSAQILFFGAEFTQVYANRYGSKIVASSAPSNNYGTPERR
ncbi:MAG: YihY/virulence factor BrkB family protein [Cyanobacteria bacterium P01_A01_bin.15]